MESQDNKQPVMTLPGNAICMFGELVCNGVTLSTNVSNFFFGEFT